MIVRIETYTGKEVLVSYQDRRHVKKDILREVATEAVHYLIESGKIDMPGYPPQNHDFKDGFKHGS